MSDNTQKTKDAVQDVMDTVTDAAHDAKNATKDAAHDAKNAAKDATHDAKNAVKDATHDATERGRRCRSRRQERCQGCCQISSAGIAHAARRGGSAPLCRLVGPVFASRCSRCNHIEERGPI